MLFFLLNPHYILRNSIPKFSEEKGKPEIYAYKKETCVHVR